MIITERNRDYNKKKKERKKERKKREREREKATEKASIAVYVVLVLHFSNYDNYNNKVYIYNHFLKYF